MLNLKPEATIEGFIAGVLACFCVFTATSLFLYDSDWFRSKPTRLSYIPLDKTAIKVDDSNLFASDLWTFYFVENLGLEPIFFTASAA